MGRMRLGLGLVGGPQLPAFTPSHMNGCVLWLRADLGVTLSSGKVSAWADQSGRGHHATQATGANQPTQVAAALNGWPVIRFSGSNVLQTPAVALDKVTVVIAHGVITTRGVLLEQSVTSASNDGFYLYSAGSAASNERRGANVDDEALTNFDPLTASVVTFTYDNVRGALWVNGAAQVTTRTGSAVSGTVTDNLYLGARSGPSVGTAGDIAEIAIFNRALSMSERQLVERYMGARYGITVA